jgi:ribA/ribD-fused uncharacterized protein
VSGVVSQFRGEHAFLSNFEPCPIRTGGRVYGSVENAFQAAKTTVPALRVPFELCSPQDAKRLGRRLPLRPDWEEIKLDVMRGMVAMKFRRGGALAGRLLATGDQELREGNTWGDRYWGCSLDGQGKNWLGRLLMERREVLRVEG